MAWVLCFHMAAAIGLEYLSRNRQLSARTIAPYVVSHHEPVINIRVPVLCSQADDGANPKSILWHLNRGTLVAKQFVTIDITSKFKSLVNF
jgi:hypothetical protein